MTKMKKIAAMTAALLICAGNMGYMPESTISIGGFTANAAEVAAESVEINEANFPDANFREFIKENFDTDDDGVLSTEEIAAVTEIYVNKKGISDLSGLKYFIKLRELYCTDNQLTSLDVSNNTALEEIKCNGNQLTTLNVSNNRALLWVHCKDNQLTSLDISNNSKMGELRCDNNQLTTLDVSKNTALTGLYCDGNQITTLDVSKNTSLFDLSCSSNQLTTLDVSNNTSLKYLFCYSNQLTTIDVSNNTGLEQLSCGSNQLTALDISKNTALEYLYCSSNQLTTLDVSNNKKLNTLFCNDNHLPFLDLYDTEASIVTCVNNVYEITSLNTVFDLSTLPKGFDVTKTSDWTNGTVEGNILTIEDTSKEVTYKYLYGYGVSETFTLIPTKSAETPEKPPVSFGDVNNDGTIDSIDASSVLAHYAAVSTGGSSSFSAEQIKAADVNKDEKCDSIDASLMLAYYAHTSTGGTGTIEDYLSNTNTAEQLKALREKKESEVQLFAAAYIGCTDDMNEVDAVKWIKENSPVFYENYSFVEDIPSGQIAGTPMGELYCIVPFDENSTVAINRIVQDENGNGSYENVIYRSESGEPVLLFCNNSGVDGDTMVTITDSDGNKDVWFPGLDEKLMMNCPYNANYDTFVYDFSQYQEILEKEHTSRKKNGWNLPPAADLQFTYWSGVDYRGSEVIGSYQIEFSEDTAYIKWVDGDEEHEFKDVEWQLEVEQDAAVVTFNFNEFAGILQYNFLWNENNSKLYTAVNFTNEDTLDENLKLYRILDRYEYSEPIS